MKKDLAKIQAMYDFLVDQIESGDYHLDDIQMSISENLEDFLSIGCEPAKLAAMMDPVEVLARIELFKGVDINLVAKRLYSIDFETFFDQLVSLGLKAEMARKFVAEWDVEDILKRSDGLQKCGFSKKELADMLFEKIDGYWLWGFPKENLYDIISTSEHLDAFLSKLRRESDCEYGVIPFDVETLLRYGADREVIIKWVVGNYTSLLLDEDYRKTLSELKILPSDAQIAEAMYNSLGELGFSPVYDTVVWMLDKIHRREASDYITHFMIDYEFIYCENGLFDPCDLVYDLIDRGLMTREDVPEWYSDWFLEEEEDD